MSLDQAASRIKHKQRLLYLHARALHGTGHLRGQPLLCAVDLDKVCQTLQWGMEPCCDTAVVQGQLHSTRIVCKPCVTSGREIYSREQSGGGRAGQEIQISVLLAWPKLLYLG